jgi:hypothetical protein
MKPRTGQKRRLHARFPFAAQLKASQLSPPDEPRPRSEVLRSETENISTGGVCVHTERPLESFRLVRCELRLPEVPVDLPFLAQVRWIEKRSGVNQYRIGLQFVL